MSTLNNTAAEEPGDPSGPRSVGPEEAPAKGRVVVTGQWRKTGNGTVVPLRYVDAVEAAGGHPIVLSTFSPPERGTEDGIEVLAGLEPTDPGFLDGAVGLVIPGGGDVDPAWYGAPRHPRTRNVSHQRDRFEATLLTAALERDMPVLAVCHGMQLLNVHLGGTLDQHLADRPTRIDHDKALPQAEPVHRVGLRRDNLLHDVLDTAHFGVNSHHHQGLDEVAQGLEEVGWSEDGVLEAVVSTERSWVVGVQWHPESMAETDETQMAIFEAFVYAATEYSSTRPSP